MGPGLGLGSIGEKVHDDRSLVDSLVNAEEGLAGNLLNQSRLASTSSDPFTM